MSAYVVHDETINIIVSYLFSKANGLHRFPKLDALGFDLSSRPSCHELAHKMFVLNVEAVDARYGEGEAEKLRPLDFKSKFVFATQIEVIKALAAWKDQCTEGPVPYLALYKALTEVHYLLCIDFVEQTEEYEAAPWG